MATPYVEFHLRSASSTQPEARARYAGVPVLVVADRQTAGRGRSGADWVDADRALAASLAFEPGWPPTAAPTIALVAGLAAAASVPGDIRLKWPNDLMLGGAKVGGILVEQADGLVVAGLGVNLWWARPVAGAGSVFDDDPGSDAPRPLARAWAADLLGRLSGGPERWGRTEYLQMCDTVGREVTWEPDGRGVAVDVDEAGGLVVATPSGVVTLRSGAVRTLRSAD